MTFVASPNGLINLARAEQPRPYRMAITDDYYADYAEIWRKQPEVRTVISFLARNVAQLNMQVFRRLGDNDRERLTDHPLSDYFSKPNPWTSQYRLWNAVVHDLGIYDLSIGLKLGSPAAPSTVRIPPWRAKPVGDNWISADKWEVSGSKGKITYDREQLVILHGYNPTDDRIGTSALEALRTILAEEFEASRSRQQAWRNGSRYSGIITRPAIAPVWSPTAKERFKADWAAGPGGPAGATPILEDGMEYAPSSMTPEQMQYIAGRRLTREEVAAAYFVPPPMVGILDNANYSNAELFHRSLYQDTLGPWLTLIQQEYMLQLVSDVTDNQDVYVEFNLREKLEGSFAEQATQLQSATGGPWMLRNEARARMNLPAVDGGDDLIVPLNVTTGGQASPTDSAPPPKSLGEAIDAFLIRQGKSVGAALGARPGGDWWAGDRWQAELTDDLYAAAGGWQDREKCARLAAVVNADTKAQLDLALTTGDPKAAVVDAFTAARSRADQHIVNWDPREAAV